MKFLTTKYKAWEANAEEKIRRLGEQTGLELTGGGERALKFASRCFMAGEVINAALPLLVTGGLLSLAAVQAAAQTPGGQIFGANDQTTGRGIVSFIKWCRNGIFLLGIFSFMWAGFNLVTEKPYGSKALGGVACMGFAALAQLAYSFSQGNDVQFNTDLGN
jgi:hypothetical protein